MEEAGRACDIPIAVLREYERRGLCGGERDGETDRETLSLLLTLHDAGFSPEEIGEYMRLALCGGDSVPERMAMLREKRERLLEQIHCRQERLDRLDYLRYKTAQESKNEKNTR